MASVTQLSPFRYPGGKTWLVPYVLEWIRTLPVRPKMLVDPFLGGGSVPLSVLHEGMVERLILREIDEDVGAVWACVFGDTSGRLCKRILNFPISRENVIKELSGRPNSIVDKAFQTILRNRTYRGGILANGASLMKDGENGHGVASRWYPETLVKRIHRLRQLGAHVRFDCGDGLDLIEEHAGHTRVAYFIDPPYTAGNGKRAGTRLYAHSRLDHERLFALMSECAGSFLMTYDDDPYVEELARQFAFHVERIPMKNTHHERKFELAITNRA